MLMNVETVRDYCLSLPLTTEDMAFGEDYLLFRVEGRIFACCGLNIKDYFVVKADPEQAIDLRERYSEISPAWHWNKKYWIQMSFGGSLSDELIKSLIRKSYAEVVKKLPKRVLREHPELSTVG